MGSPGMPSVAYLLMTDWETISLMNPDVNPFFDQISFYEHYVDYCFLIFDNAFLINLFLDWITLV